VSNAAAGQPPLAPEERGKLYPLRDGDTDGLVICCSSPSFSEAFHDFIHDELGLIKPALIMIPGSAGSFGISGSLPKLWYALRRHIDLLSQSYKFTRVVIINHEDCKGYQAFAKHLGGLDKLPFLQRVNLNHLARMIQEQFVPGAKFELYFAKIVVQAAARFTEFERIL
jgi:hypothetical protein